jgi:hypothetical protein
MHHAAQLRLNGAAFSSISHRPQAAEPKKIAAGRLLRLRPIVALQPASGRASHARHHVAPKSQS